MKNDTQAFLDDTPTAKLIRQVLGAVSEFDKAMTVAKLKGARDRKRKATGKCEGRKSHAEMAIKDPKHAVLVAEAKRLRRAYKGRRRSLREVAAELASKGFRNANGAPYAAMSIRSMVEGP